MTSYFSIDGNILSSGDPADALVKDRGLAYGHGLFETILFNDGKLPLLDRHLQRICYDAPKIGISIQHQLIDEYIRLYTNQLSANGHSDGVVKLIVTAGVGGRSYASPNPIQPSIICAFSPLPNNLPQQRQQGIAVRCCNYKLPNNQVLAGIKHLNRLDQVIARLEWNSADYDEGLLFNSENNLIEAISANVFIKHTNGDWLTPDITFAGVSGVMRSLLLEKLFADCCIPVKVARIDFKSLNNCKELFICNSIRGIVPINTIYTSSGDLIKRIPIGKQTLTLQAQLKKNYPSYK